MGKQKPSKYNLISEQLRENIKRNALFLLKVDRRIKWLGAGMFCFALFGVLSQFPEFTEKYYSQGLHVAIRYFYDYTLGLLPFSSTLWLNLIFFLWLLYKIFKYVRFNFSNHQVSIKNRIAYTALSAGSFLGKISVIFFVGWGFNYQRIPIEEYTGIGIESMYPQDILEEVNIARKMVIQERANIQSLTDTTAFDESLLPENMEEEMRNNTAHILRMMGYPAPGKPRCRTLHNDYWLKEIGYTGIYVSFYGEALLGSRIPAVYRPFLMSHELVHAYGFFDEADANFVAYLACLNSDNSVIRYSGLVSHLVYLNHEFDIFRFKYSKGLRNDLRASGTFASQNEYNRMILLVRAWRNKYPLKLDKPIRENLW